MSARALELERAERTRRRAAGAVTRRRQAAIQELNRVLLLADDALTTAHAPFVFQCPRCAQKQRVARIRITQTPKGPAVQHELPVCDAFYERDRMYVYRLRPMKVRIRVYTLTPEEAALVKANPQHVLPQARPLLLTENDPAWSKEDF